LWQTPDVGSTAGGRSARGQSEPHKASLEKQCLWLTPRANEPDSDPNFVARNADRGDHCHGALSSQVKQWATPRAGKTTDENPATWALRKAKGDVATMPLTAQVKCWGTPAANDANKTPHCEVNSNQAGLAKSVGLELQKQWATPKASDPQHSGPNMRDSAGNYALPAQAVRENWATPIQGDSHLASTPEAAQKRIEEGKVTLSRQTVAEQWGSPRTGIRADTHFSYDRGKHNIEEQAGSSIKGGGKLNPRWVETLMGLPVGWTMPSCASPQTIAQTNCDSSATESSPPPQPARSQPFFPNSAETIDTP
jgi:hypothetical protein